MLLVLVAGLFLLFPGLQRSELTFRHHLDTARCVERVMLELFDDDVLARAHRQLVEGRYEITHTAKLRNRRYEAVVSLECRDGSRVEISRQPITVDGDRVIEFNHSGDECRCS